MFVNRVLAILSAIVRAPHCKMRVPYSNHIVCPSVRAHDCILRRLQPLKYTFVCNTRRNVTCVTKIVLNVASHTKKLTIRVSHSIAT